MEGFDSPDKYSDSFSVILNCELKNSRSPMADEEVWNNRAELGSSLSKASRLKNLIFSNQEEMNELVKVFGELLALRDSQGFSDQDFRLMIVFVFS